MKFSVSNKDPFGLQHQLLVVLCDEASAPQSALPKPPDEVKNLVTEANRLQSYKASPGKELFLPVTGHQKIPQILVVGIGKVSEFDLENVRKAAAKGAKQARQSGAERVAIHCPFTSAKKAETDQVARAVAEGFLLGLYKYDKFKSQKKDDGNGENALPKKKVREAVVYVLEGGKKEESAWESGLALGEAIANGVNTARDLSNAPPNEMTPTKMGQEAQRIAGAQGSKVSCKILGLQEIKKENMGGLLGVSQGSDQQPRLVILEYWGAKKSEAPVVVAGKGITFDSGGISLKPSSGMDEMKHDMSGAATVIGLFEALRELKPKVNVVGLAACAENMPSGKAIRPGDILKTRSGKTVEVLNTDAEGRLVLCDALDYAKKYKPKAIIDLATLTGACVVALGHEAAALMGNDDQLKRKLQEAAAASGERVWEMPLYEEHTDALKSEVADLKNVGGRDAGALTAGAFLQSFVDKSQPWAHLDIAGTAWLTKPRGYYGRGATGYGVRLLVDYLLLTQAK